MAGAAAVTWTGVVKVNLIPANVPWLANVKLDPILSCEIIALGAVKVDLIPANVHWLADVKLDLITALGQPATAIISTPLKWLHQAPGENATVKDMVRLPAC